MRRRPFVQWQAPLVWTTLSLTLHADGTYERRSPRPGEPRIDAQQIFLSRYRAV